MCNVVVVVVVIEQLQVEARREAGGGRLSRRNGSSGLPCFVAGEALRTSVSLLCLARP